jgi:RNA polymerase sigma-70 factor (ECF subfamily)
MDEFSQALEALVGRSRTAVLGVGARHGLGEAEIDELFQDVRIRLWKARDGDPGGLVDLSPSYVYRTAVSAALDMIRRKRREGAYVRLDDDIPGPSRVRPDRALEEEALARRLEAALHRLHERRRPVVRMHLAGYSREEIATLLGWTEAKTRNLLYRGLADLRGLLGREE